MSWPALSLTLTLALVAGGALARWRLMVVTVVGASMSPTYQPGDRVLVLRTGRVHRRRVVVARPPGNMVVDAPGASLPPLPPPAELLRPADLRPDGAASAVRAAHRADGLIIKRVVAVPGDEVPPSVRAVVADATVPAGKLVLIGDGQASADSRVWGFSETDDLLGIVIARTHRERHVGTEGAG